MQNHYLTQSDVTNCKELYNNINSLLQLNTTDLHIVLELDNDFAVIVNESTIRFEDPNLDRSEPLTLDAFGYMLNELEFYSDYANF